MNVALASNLGALVHAPPRQWVITNSSATVPVPLSRIGVTSIARVGENTALVTTSAANRLQTGDQVTIAGATQTEYNGTFEITVLTNTTFTYGLAQKPAVTPATGTITLDAEIYFRRATLLGCRAPRTANTGTVYLGPTATNDDQPFQIAAASEVELMPALGGKWKLGDWYLDVGTVGDGLCLIFS